MGTKKADNEAHESGKLKEINKSKDNDVDSENRKTEKKKKKREEVVEPLKENDVDLGDKRTEKKKKKRKREEVVQPLKENDVELGDKRTEKKKKKKKRKREEVVEPLKENDVELGDKRTEKKKKKKRKREEVVQPLNENDVELGDKRTEKKKKKKRKREEVVEPLKENDEELGDKRTEKKKKKRKREEVVEPLKENDVELGDKRTEKKKKQKVKSAKGDAQSKSGASASITEPEDVSKNSNYKRKKKSVTFSEDVVVFPLSDESNNESKEGDLVRGKRFSPEEDKLIKWAVQNYIDEHQLGENGEDMVLNCSKHPEVKDCWKEIGAALPWRPKESVYYRAHILFERGESRTWTPDELEHVRKFYEEHGAEWKKLATELGKHRVHVKDAWRRIKLCNQKKGVWSQDEYQKLFDLVNTDLRLRALEEKKSKHGMLRDNISWGTVSDKLETRTDALCCMKWYNQLSSPMVAEGKWLDTDDYHLLMELYELDACCMEDVEWDNLLEHRSGDVCRKRWNQMVKHLGEHKDKSFPEQVEVLIGRYCPDVLEAREAYNEKEAVDS